MIPKLLLHEFGSVVVAQWLSTQSHSQKRSGKDQLSCLCEKDSVQRAWSKRETPQDKAVPFPHRHRPSPGSDLGSEFSPDLPQQVQWGSQTRGRAERVCQHGALALWFFCSHTLGTEGGHKVSVPPECVEAAGDGGGFSGGGDKNQCWGTGCPPARYRVLLLAAVEKPDPSVGGPPQQWPPDAHAWSPLPPANESVTPQSSKV